jgi:hypothetical protein
MSPLLSLAQVSLKSNVAFPPLQFGTPKNWNTRCPVSLLQVALASNDARAKKRRRGERVLREERA